MSLRVDHVLYGARDLDRAAVELEERFGLASVTGGRHAGFGTANRIVPLGSSYLEIIAVVDESEAARSSFGRWLLEQVAGGDHWVAWCVATDDLDAVAERNAVSPVPGSRMLPDGSEVRWRWAGLETALAEPWLPFFIEWDVPPHRHPGLMPASHRVRPVGVASIEVGGDESRLREWLRGEELPVHVTPGSGGVHVVSVATDAGDLVLR